jgi:outer membrane protein assembly factor BamB
VFVTETRNKKEEVVYALDRSTGQLNWKAEWPGAITVPFFASSNGSWIRSTPASDGERLFVAGMRDVLVCLDAKSGDQIWRVDFSQAFTAPLPGFGTVCSPLLDGDFIYIQAVASVVKLRKTDGEIVWRSEPESGGAYGAGMGASAFSSPVIATLGGKRQLIVQSRQKLVGVDLDTGGNLWSIEVPAFRGMNILTPLVIGNSIFTSTYGGGTFLFDVTSDSQGFKVQQRWQNKKQGYMSSPVLIEDKVYLHLRNERFTCMDPTDGSTGWTGKPTGKYWSMIVNGSRILSLDQRGQLRLIEASPDDYQEISSRSISESTTWAHLAVSGNQIFVRELDAITAWNWE